MRKHHYGSSRSLLLLLLPQLPVRSFSLLVKGKSSRRRPSLSACQPAVMTMLWGGRLPGQGAGSLFPSAGPQLTDRKGNRSRHHRGHIGRIRSDRLRRQEGSVGGRKFLPPDKPRPNQIITSSQTEAHGIQLAHCLFADLALDQCQLSSTKINAYFVQNVPRGFFMVLQDHVLTEMRLEFLNQTAV